MAVGQSIITAGGINALVEASSTGRTIKPKYFRFSEQDLVLDPTISAVDIHGWVTQDISDYIRIDGDTIEFVCAVEPDMATNYTRVAGLYLDDGTLFMVAKPPYPFPPQLRQTFKIQLRYQNADGLMDFRYISSDAIKTALESMGAGMMIKTPSIVAADGGVFVSSKYATYDQFDKPREWKRWQVAGNAEMTDIVADETIQEGGDSYTLATQTPGATYYVRTMDGADGHRSRWSEVAQYTAPVAIIETPAVTVTGAPSDVPETPTITGSAYTIAGSSEAHDHTVFRVVKVSDGSIVDEHTSESAETSYTVPAGVLSPGTEYRFEVVYYSASYQSQPGSTTATTKASFGPVFDIFGDGSRVGLWPFDGDGTDLGGQYDLLINANTSFVEGVVGEAAATNGSDAEITGPAALLNPWFGAARAISFAIKVPQSVIDRSVDLTYPINLGGNAILARSDYVSGPGLQGVIIGLSDGKISIANGRDEYPGESIQCDTVLTADTWHFVTVEKAANDACAVTVDLVLQGLSSIASSGNNYADAGADRRMCIGWTEATTYGGDTTHCEIAIDMLSYFSRTLTPSEREQLKAEAGL